ncbi:MAG: DUF5671 domain-containing protein, partial [Rhodospirillaceae bacterium]
WPPAQIRSALGAYADLPFPVPVPLPRPSLSSREAFLYLVLFSTLYFGAFNLGDLLFSLINRGFPDPLEHGYGASSWDDLRWSASAVIVSLPVFLALTRYVGKRIRENPILRLSPVRRWLTYLTLFLASSALLGDVTSLIYEVLGGGPATRFLLKVLVVALIAGTAFAYYLRDMRREEEP